MQIINCDTMRLDRGQVREAQRLLYLIYCIELNWEPTSGNPSRLAVEDGALVDDYDRQGLSIWYGVFDRKNPKEIVATGRVLHRDSAGCLELARYAIPNELRRLLAGNQQVVEMNRSGVKKSYRRTNVWARLLHAGFEYAVENNLDVVSTTAIPQVQAMHDNIGFSETNYQFKYNQTDERPAKVYWATADESASIAKKLEEIASPSPYSKL